MTSHTVGNAITGFMERLGLTNPREIGRGATATVFAARQPALSRDVAVKVFFHALTDDKARRRFERECQALGAMSSHPNVVTLLSSGFDEAERPYIVMEYCPGGSLYGVINGIGPMSVQDVLRIGVKVSSALELGHDAGLLHRDIKPANILLTSLGEPVLADFGIAGDPGELSVTIGDSLTPLYAAPEVLEYGGGSPASDVWSLASTLYALLLGHAPYAGTNDGLYGLLNRIMQAPLPALGRGDVSPEVLAVLAAGMAKDPSARTATPAALAVQLQQAQAAMGLVVTEYLAGPAVAVEGLEVAQSDDVVGDLPNAVAATRPRASIPQQQASVDRPAPLRPDPRDIAETRRRPRPEPAPADLVPPMPEAMPPHADQSLADGAPAAAHTPPSPRASSEMLVVASVPEVATTTPRPPLESPLGEREPPRFWTGRVVLLAVSILVLGLIAGIIAIDRSGGHRTASSRPVSPALHALPVVPTPHAAVTCTGLRCRLTTEPTTGARFHWQFGDGKVTDSAASGITHVYSRAGRFVGQVLVSQSGHRSSTGTFTVHLKDFKTHAVVHSPASLVVSASLRSNRSACRVSRVILQRKVNGRWTTSKRLIVGRSGRLRTNVAPGLVRVVTRTKPIAEGVCLSAVSKAIAVASKPPHTTEVGAGAPSSTSSASSTSSGGSGSGSSGSSSTPAGPGSGSSGRHDPAGPT